MNRHANDTSSSSGGLFQPNSIKYRDAGAHPATGRSGSAQVQSRALLAKDGSTLVEATTGVLDGPPGPGSITKVQAKLFNPDGSLQQTQNYNSLTTGPYTSDTYSTLVRNDKVQLDTHVNGVDPRTDDVTVVDVVKLRPDIAVRSLNGPAQAYVNTSVIFQAVISELNQDVGAHANCVLSVDGQPVDSAVAIWVDAGQSVSCMFAYTFSATGTHAVSVAVVNVVPGDFDPSNNTAQTSIEVVQPVSNLSYQGQINSFLNQLTTTDSLTGQFSGYSDNATYTESSFSAFMYAYTPNVRFTFPIQSFGGTVTIDGTVAWSPTFTAQLAPPVNDGNSICQNQYTDSAFGTVCAYNSGLSAAEWYGTTGAVTYYSTHTDYTCTPTCTSNSYIVNNTSFTYGTGAPNLNIGTTQQLGLTLVDGSATSYGAQTLVMTASSSGYTYGFDTCESFLSGNYCFGNHGTVSNKSASDNSP
ncbi:MAG TPA: hypothetical protein VE826_12495 [Dongiaceae bacterium]|nr:hypothetical protein [Dongiaceae bacterium]